MSNSRVRDTLDYEEEEEYNEEEECDHRWQFVGQNHHGSYYRCLRCGLEEEC